MNATKPKLIKNGSNNLEFIFGEHRFKGSKLDIVVTLETLGYAPREIANALASLEMNKHQWAEFNSDKVFTVSGAFKN